MSIGNPFIRVYLFGAKVDFGPGKKPTICMNKFCTQTLKKS